MQHEQRWAAAANAREYIRTRGLKCPAFEAWEEVYEIAHAALSSRATARQPISVRKKPWSHFILAIAA
ncbi:hypothetical protein MnTg02_00505 [bacterium MnTg02]|nr:hypothetical protein MnTg02_00505 [bacterium MnTg02]